jgi:hypothetical protein
MRSLHEGAIQPAAQDFFDELSGLPCSADRLHTAEVPHLAAHPDRTAFALKNHADAVLHFRKMAADAERLAAMYRVKVDAHIDAARQRVNPEAFDAWLQSICRK